MVVEWVDEHDDISCVARDQLGVDGAHSVSGEHARRAHTARRGGISDVVGAVLIEITEDVVGVLTEDFHRHQWAPRNAIERWTAPQARQDRGIGGVSECRVIVDDVVECQHAIGPLWIVDDWVERVAGVRVEEGFGSLDCENFAEDEVLPHLADPAEVTIRHDQE